MVSVKRSIHDRKGPFMIDKKINKNHTNLAEAQQGWYWPLRVLASHKYGQGQKAHTTVIQTNKFQGLFKDFLRTNYSFQGLKIYSINWRFWTSFWALYLLKLSMESFTIFTSSAMVDYIILCYFPKRHFAKWLGMTRNCIWGTEQKGIGNKETEIKHHSFTKMFLHSYKNLYVSALWVNKLQKCK